MTSGKGVSVPYFGKSRDFLSTWSIETSGEKTPDAFTNTNWFLQA
jgi:hypothetical protein